MVNPRRMPPIDEDFLNKIKDEFRPIIAECLSSMSKEEVSLIVKQIYTMIKEKGR